MFLLIDSRLLSLRRRLWQQILKWVIMSSVEFSKVLFIKWNRWRTSWWAFWKTSQDELLSQCFLRLHQICTSQNHKNHFFFFCLLLSYFWNNQPKFSQKGKSIAPNTIKYFQEHRRKGYCKIKRFAFCLINGSYLKFLGSKIIYIQI